VSDRVRILPTSRRRPWNTVEGDVKGGLAKSLRKAVGGGAPVPTPIGAMHEEHKKLLKAFREAEGRDPSPDLNSDQEFWKAYGDIMERRAGFTTIGDGSGSAEASMRKALKKAR
jgi:hypothetical protein